MRRSIALLAVLLLAAVACASGEPAGELADEEGSYGSGIDLGFEDRDREAPQGGEAPAPGQAPAPVAGHPVPAPSDEPDAVEPDLRGRPTDGGRTGNNAFYYLNSQVPRLVVEITAMEGLEPHGATIGLLRERLGAVADKPGGIEVVVNTVPRSGRSEWSMSDIQDHERLHRRFSSSREAAVIYIQFIEGRPQEGDAIGIAYSSSSSVIFLERIRSAAATPLITAEKIERSTTLHEVGHLLALVNLTYQSPRDREDPDHRGHSSNPDSVMYWAVDSVGVASLLQGRTEPPTAFDADDLADLADLADGRLP